MQIIYELNSKIFWHPAVNMEAPSQEIEKKLEKGSE